MKLGIIADPRFHKSFSKLVAAEVPIRVAFQLKSIAKAINEEVVKYEELRRALIQECGIKKEDGTLDIDEKGIVKFEEQGGAVFQKQMSELMNIEVILPSIKLSDLGESTLLSLADLTNLEGIILEA